jgi:hypothetical protein
MDRRYSQARGAGGVRAADAGRTRSRALARAQLARARVGARSIWSKARGRGSQSISNAGDINRGRAAEREELGRVFEAEGSGVYGYKGWDRGEGRFGVDLDDPRTGLLD